MRLTLGERAERRKVLAAAVAAGEHPADVARRFKVTIEQVRLSCQEHGVGRSGYTRRVQLSFTGGPLRVLAAILRSEDRDTLTSIAAALGVSKQYVWKVASECWRLGIPTGRWKPPKPKPAPLDPGPKPA